MEPTRGDATARAPVRTAFVGRELELDWLLERVGHASRGRPRACMVRGAAGVGKSRLLAELGRHALGAGLHVWSVSGSPDVQTPYLALDALIQDLEARCISGPALAEASARWWEQVQREPGDAPGVLATALSGPPQRSLSLAFQRALFERASHGGLVVLVDDLQWLDGPSLDLLVDAIAAAGERASEERVALALIMASRGAAPASAAERAERRLELELICDATDLRGFEDREAEEFVRALGVDPPARALVTRLRAATEGSPARLEDLVRELRQRGALLQRGRSWIATLDPLAIDAQSRAVLDLPSGDPLRQLLRVLGLFAGEASNEAIVAATGAASGDVQGMLARGEARGWLRRSGHGAGFVEPALGRALAEEIPESERAGLHHRIACWLEASGADDPETLAHHWRHAWPQAPSERVIEALRTAAQQAMRARDWRRAAFHYERALHVAEESALPEAQTADLHYRAGLAHFRSLDGDPSRMHFERAAAAHQATGDLAGEVRARLEAMRASMSLSNAAYGSRPAGLAELELLLERLAEDETPLRAYATAEVAVAHAMARDTKAAEPLARSAVELSARAGDDVRCLAHEMLGIVLMGKLDLAGAERAYGEALRFARRTGDAWLESLALNRLPIALIWQGRLDEARSYLLSAREAADATGDWADYSLALGTLAALAVARGDFDEVESLARQAVSIARRSGYTWGAALAISAVAPARALRGRLDEARDAAALLETPGLLARELPAMWGAMAAVLRLRLTALAGEVDAEARERAAGLASVLLASETDPHVLPALCACVEIAAQAGDVETAERVGPRIAEAARSGVVFTPALDDVLARALGLVAESAGRRGEAVDLYEEALEAAERGGARMLQARVHADLARVLAAEGRPAEAERSSRRALLLAEQLGMEPLRARCASSLAARAGVAGAPERRVGLSSEERRLLHGIAAGLDAGAIAGDLLLTREGFERLRERVFSRIGVSGNVEAAAFAHREGLMVPPQRGRDPALEEISRRAPPVRSREPRVLTVFVSDIANSSELIQRLGDERAQALIQEHNRIVRLSFRRLQGVELQHTGDGFIATFESAAQAVRCAASVQSELEVRHLGPVSTPLRIRIGLHVGEPLLEEGRLFGVAMHTAARICGACEGGQILVSDEAWRAASVESELEAEHLGPVPLRGIFEPVSLHRMWGAPRTPAGVK
jgi:class 3 adenylate cyclase/tetratricopeptide (TPR) repeat protein